MHDNAKNVSYFSTDNPLNVLLTTVPLTVEQLSGTIAARPFTGT